MRCALALLLAATAAAQDAPHLGYVFPAGAARGATVEVQVGGRLLEGTTAAVFAGAGVTAEVLSCIRPLTNEERNALREEAQQLDKVRRAGNLDADGVARRAAIQRQLAIDQQRQPTPQLADSVVLAVTVAADAPLGPRDLRLCTAAGLSNPLRFCVVAGTETRESEPNDRQADAGAAAALPVVVNGQILPGDVDRFAVHLLANQRLAARVRARALIPYLADAVPGWFQATLTLYTDQGREVAFADDHLFEPDPQLEYDVPVEGDYEIEVRDALYRGRDDFVYRLELQALPLAAANAARLTASAPPLGPLPPLAEREPDDSKQTAQPVVLPCVVVGRIERPGDVDVYAIDGHYGQQLVAEVMARRIGSPFDGILRLLDPQGREVALSDDRDDQGSGLVTHQADPYIHCKLSAQGTHLLYVRDLQGKGGAEYTYRLRLSPPQPDFVLHVVPSSLNLRAGGAAAFAVHAQRHDGFAGEIALSLLAPAGFRLGGGLVPAGLTDILVTLTAPAEAPKTPVRLVVEGTATIGGTTVKRPAVPADDMMQAFAWHHLVPADELLACVLPGGPALGPLGRRDAAPVQLRPGSTAEVEFDLDDARHALPEGIRCQLRDPPAGLTVAGTRVRRDGFVVVVKADKTVKAGLAGNLLLDATVDRPATAAAAGKGQPARERIAVLLPAVGFLVLRR